MKLITWNVAGRVAKLPAQAKRLLGLDLDVVCLQEVTVKTVLLWRDIFESKGYVVHDSFELCRERSCLNGRRKYGELVASRYPLETLEPTEFPIPWTERILSVSVQTPHGTLELHNAHLPAGASDRREGTFIKSETFEGIAVRLRKAAAADHRILCGDFNSPEEERADGAVLCWGGRWDTAGHAAPRTSERFIRQYQAEHAVMVDTATLGMTDVYRGLHGYEDSGYSWATRNGSHRRFDHVFASGALAALKADYLLDWLTDGLSDHAPLLVRLGSPEA
jgi:exonuclease III